RGLAERLDRRGVVAVDLQDHVAGTDPERGRGALSRDVGDHDALDLRGQLELLAQRWIRIAHGHAAERAVVARELTPGGGGGPGGGGARRGGRRGARPRARRA